MNFLIAVGIMVTASFFCEANEKFLSVEDWLHAPDDMTDVMMQKASNLLSTYEGRNSGCFKEAAMSLREGCSSLKESNPSDVDKVKYAIRLASCEFQTGDLQLPAPCSSHLLWNQVKPRDRDERQWFWTKGNTKYEANEGNKVQSCVRAMAEVPQLWTSYSGHLRDVVQMCFSVRHQIERDLTREIHQKVTKANARSIRSMQLHLEQIKQWRDSEAVYFTELEARIERMLKNAQAADEVVLSGSQNFLKSFEEIIQSNVDMRKQTASLLSQTTELRRKLESIAVTSEGGLAKLSVHVHSIIEMAATALRQANVLMEQQSQELAIIQKSSQSATELVTLSFAELKSQAESFAKIQHKTFESASGLSKKMEFAQIELDRILEKSINSSNLLSITLSRAVETHGELMSFVSNLVDYLLRLKQFCLILASLMALLTILPIIEGLKLRLVAMSAHIAAFFLLPHLPANHQNTQLFILCWVIPLLIVYLPYSVGNDHSRQGSGPNQDRSLGGEEGVVVGSCLVRFADITCSK
ncbi:hypothetical protein BJ742DRAFT_515787 [Cladochytrium replicatum]|nr:hypothetical protein BJ742DRAFT_515787 [Cladochytrium replicatum]